MTSSIFCQYRLVPPHRNYYHRHCMIDALLIAHCSALGNKSLTLGVRCTQSSWTLIFGKTVFFSILPRISCCGNHSIVMTLLGILSGTLPSHFQRKRTFLNEATASKKLCRSGPGSLEVIIWAVSNGTSC